MSFDVVILAYIILIVTAIFFTFTIRRSLSKFSQGVAYFVLIFLALELFLFQYTQTNFTGPTRLYFDIKNAEFNYDATFASMLLFASFVISTIIAITHRIWWQILVWLYIASLFLFLAFDEYFQIHESFYSWEYVYSAVAAITSLVLLGIFWKFYPRKQLIAWVAIIGGMGLAAVGGIGLEKYVADACLGIIESQTCRSLPLMEEILEGLGYGTSVVGMLLFAEQSIASKRWNRFKPLTILSLIAWVIVCIYAYWLHPIVAHRLFATPVYADFADSQMVLIGYRLDKDYTHPEDTFNITMYWRSDIVPSHPYGYTINLVHPTTGESLVLDNKKIVNTPTHTWFSGTTHRISRTVHIPEDIDTPVNPLILITVWREESNGYRTINPGETDTERFGEGSPIIAELPIISNESAKNETALYNFDNGAQLLSYTVDSDEADEIELTFEWSTTERIPVDLSQMLHLVHENGEDRLVFDQPPFQYAFSTTSWIPNMNETTTWHIDIPDDAPSGTYTIQTGLYDTQGVRVGASNLDGNAITDNIISLGEIVIEDD